MSNIIYIYYLCAKREANEIIYKRYIGMPGADPTRACRQARSTTRHSFRHNLAPIVSHIGAHRGRLGCRTVAAARPSCRCGGAEASQGAAVGRGRAPCVSSLRQTFAYRFDQGRGLAPDAVRWMRTFAKRKEMKTYIKEYLQKNGITQKELADRLGVTQATVSATISRPSFPTLERIAAALDVEPWQLLAPPAVVEELKQARAQQSGGGGGGLVGVVRVGCEIYTADTVQQLRAIVERLERDAAGK